MENTKRNARIREQVDRLGIPCKEMLEKEIARYERKAAYKKLLGTTLISLMAVVAATIVITNLWLAVLQIDGSSMSPLLEMNEIVIAVRDDTPERNDIIAFNHNNQIYVKRVIALAGGWIEINEDGTVSVNGARLDEPYITELSIGTCDLEFPYQVPAGTVFVMGDNRASSLDSRDSRIGPVSRDQIIGKVKFSVWPLSQIGSMS